MQRYMIAALTAATLAVSSGALAESLVLEASDFHGIDAATGIRVVATAGQPYSVHAEADARDLGRLRHEVRNGVLTLWLETGLGNILDFSRDDITVTIGAEILHSLAVSAGASIEASAMVGEEIALTASSGGTIMASAIEGIAFEVRASSGASIEATGLCDTARVEVSAGATVSAKSLDCARVTLDVSSGATLAIAARDAVSASVSGGGSAAVYGSPDIEGISTSGGGNFSLRN